MIVTLTRMLELGSGEDKAWLLLTRLTFLKDIREQAAIVITNAYRFKKMVERQVSEESEQYKLQLGKLKREMFRFQKMRFVQRSLYGIDSTADRLEKKMNTITQEHEKLKSFLALILKKLEKLKMNVNDK